MTCGHNVLLYVAYCVSFVLFFLAFAIFELFLSRPIQTKIERLRLRFILSIRKRFQSASVGNRSTCQKPCRDFFFFEPKTLPSETSTDFSSGGYDAESMCKPSV